MIFKHLNLTSYKHIEYLSNHKNLKKELKLVINRV